jgi:hypothetical protein
MVKLEDLTKEELIEEVRRRLEQIDLIKAQRKTDAFFMKRLQEELDDLALELKGEKQMSITQQTVYQQQVKALKQTVKDLKTSSDKPLPIPKITKFKAVAPPALQLYFGEKPIIIEKTYRAWKTDPEQLETNLRRWWTDYQIMWEKKNDAERQLVQIKNEKKELLESFDKERGEWKEKEKDLKINKDVEKTVAGDWYTKYHNTLDYYKKVW